MSWLVSESPLPSSQAPSTQSSTDNDGTNETSPLLDTDRHVLTTYSSFPPVDHLSNALPPATLESVTNRRRRRSTSTSSPNETDGREQYVSAPQSASPASFKRFQLTTIDWLSDSIRNHRQHLWLARLPGLRGHLLRWTHSFEKWLIVAVIGALVALVAYTIDSIEPLLFDLKVGYCRSGWHKTQRICCTDNIACQNWISWGDALTVHSGGKQVLEYFIYITSTVVLASLSCFLAMKVKLPGLPDFSPPLIDRQPISFDPSDRDLKSGHEYQSSSLTYPATGSGVAEVRLIMSGFVIHGYLGMTMLLVKAASLILSVASGLAIGKEGPYVHLSSAIANLISRSSSKQAGSTHRAIIGAGAAAGIAVAFGAPISGVFFILEEMCQHFSRKMLLPTLTASIIAATGLRLLSGTEKTVLFQVRYSTEWHIVELGLFLLLGLAGGALGALLIRFTRLWTRHARSRGNLGRFPLGEVALVALFTGLATFWNKYTTLRPDRLLYELSAECIDSESTGSCSTVRGSLQSEMSQLLLALVIKAVLTCITLGIKVPAGIYIPTMILGALLGRLVGTALQHILPTSLPAGLSLPGTHPQAPSLHIIPGRYALLTAAASLCGITRLPTTTVLIISELTGSTDHIIPATVTVLAAKRISSAIEPLSLYDHLTQLNNYPLLNDSSRPGPLDGTLADLLPPGQRSRNRSRSRSHENIIDITHSSLVKSNLLHAHLSSLQRLGAPDPDAVLPVFRHNALVGVLPAADLARALHRTHTKNSGAGESSGDVRCLLAEDERHELALMDGGDDGGITGGTTGTTGTFLDLRHVVEPAPVGLEGHSSLELVWECFGKLGVRQVCVLREGRYMGMVHKTALVRYIQARRAT